MASVATIQLLVDQDDPAQISETLTRAAKLLEEQGIAITVRTHGADGQPIISHAPQRAAFAMHMGFFTPALAWPEHMLLPYGPILATDETDTGVLNIRIPSCIQKPGCSSGDIDLRVFVTEEGVQTTLLPVGVFDDMEISGSKSSMTFERAAGIQSGSPRQSPAGVQGRLFDTATGRPIIGPAYSVPAIASYDYAIRDESGFRLSGVKIDDYIDGLAHPLMGKVGDDTLQLFFTDDGTVIPESRVELQLLTADEGNVYGAPRS